MIPTGWIEKLLGEISVVGAGNSAPQGDENFTGGIYPFFRTADVGRAHFGIINNSADLLNEEGKTGLKLFKKGTILFPKSGASTFLNHRVMMDVDGFVVSHLATITPNESIISGKYLLYYLSTIDSKTLIQDQSYPSLNLPIISSINVKCPEDIKEQQRIVEKLDTLFADIEKEKQITQQNLQNAKELFESESHKLFTENTDGWEEKQLGEICNIAIGKTPSRGSKAFWDTELQTNNTWLSIADLNSAKNKIVDTSTERISNKALPLMTLVSKGTLLLSFKLTIGRLAFAGKDLYTNEAIAQLPIKDGVQIDKYYLYYYLSVFDYETLLKGDVKVKGKSLNKQKLNVLPVSYPSLSEQQRIVEKLDALQEQVQKLEQIYTQQIAGLDELKQAILKKAFNGEL